MRKIVSIPLVILILFTGITFNIATHYCGGSVAATKVSLDGKLATCGMESSSDNKPEACLFKTHCCDDVTAACKISCNYFPSFSFVNDLYRQVLCVAWLPAAYIPYQRFSIMASIETIRPPGRYCPDSVDLQVLCISRI